MQDLFIFAQNHLGLTFALFAILILLAIIEVIKIKKGVKRISPQQVVRMMNHENAVVVDIRAKDLFDKGHIVGAMSIPLSEIKEKTKRLEKLKSSPIIVVSATGMEATPAMTILTQQGITQSYILKGGMTAWRESHLPLVKE